MNTDVTVNPAMREDIIETRRRHVSSLRIRGLTVREIQTALAELRHINPETGAPWSIGTIQADLDALSEQWKKDALENTGALKAKINAELEEVKRVGWSDKDLQNILKAIQQQRDLFGLDAPKQTQLGGIPDGAPIQIQSGSLLEGIDLAKLTKEQLDALEAAVTTLDSLRTDRGGAGEAQP